MIDALVVSDTSPLRALAHIHLMDVLPRLFERVIVPTAVAEELRHPRPSFAPLDVNTWPFIHIQAVGNPSRVTHLPSELHPGEAEAIALALELGAAHILIDEADGRNIALAKGLIPVGVLRLLNEAKKLGLISDVRTPLDRLRTELRFFLSERVRADVLRQAGESEGG